MIQSVATIVDGGCVAAGQECQTQRGIPNAFLSKGVLVVKWFLVIMMLLITSLEISHMHV